jgi:hypothetical protein
MNDVARPQLSETEVEQQVESFHGRLGAIRTEVRKVIVGQDDVVDHLLLTLLVGGHCLHGEDAAGAHAGRRARTEVQAHPVHAGPDAHRRHRHRHHR